jgi:hypothetical protein
MTAITSSTTSATVSTRTLLSCAAVAAPLWAAVALIQAATREGFDLTRHPLSALLTIVGAAGLRRVMHGKPGGKWAPRLVRVNGIGMMAAGIFVMDPADGFPVGTPAGMPTTLSWHSYAHFASGTIAFAALIAACYVLGRHYSRAGDRVSAIASRVAGTAALAGNLWAMTGGKTGSLTLAVGVIAAMLWVATVAARYLRSL